MPAVTPQLGAPRVHPPRGAFSLADLSQPVVHRLVERSCGFYADIDAHDRPLAGKVVGILFTKTSTRTRTAFSVGSVLLGGSQIAFGPNDLQTNTGESLADTARVFGMMLDLLVVRTSAPIAQLRMISQHGGIPLINAMAAEEHPTQGICDLATIRLLRGSVDGVRLLYVGEGNNTATALVQGLSFFPNCHATFATPPGYALPAEVLAAASKQGAPIGTDFTEVHSLGQLPEQVDVVYATRWQTTGTAKSDPAWREAFRPFFVDEELMDRWPGALFMHDLPANRGEEVSAGTIDGSRSAVWPQARMKLTSAMAVLEWVARKEPDREQ